jgi:hypothetical protein
VIRYPEGTKKTKYTYPGKQVLEDQTEKQSSTAEVVNVWVGL